MQYIILTGLFYLRKLNSISTIRMTYVLYPDEGHGFARPENRLSFNAITDLFLAEHLGGRTEPIGDDFKGSSIKVPTGADQILTLSETLGQ